MSSEKYVQTKEVLRQASDTICQKLHNKDRSTLTDDVESASKYTRRNAQYKTMGNNLLHYWVHVAVFGREPGLKEIQNSTVKLYTRSPVGELNFSELPAELKMFKALATTKDFVDLTHKVEIKQYADLDTRQITPSSMKGICKIIEIDQTIDNTKKSSYKDFHFDNRNGRKDWTYSMTNYLEQHMSVFVRFAFDQLSDYGEKCDQYGVRLAHVNGELAKLKKTNNKTIENEFGYKMWGDEEERRHNYEADKRELQAHLREPSILFKLYQGMLLELDLEELLNMWIMELEETNFEIPYESKIKLIRSLISDICNSVYGKMEAEFQDSLLNSLMKNLRYNEVLTELRDKAIKAKYCKFQIDDCEGNDIDILPIKDFPKMAINREVVECFHTTTQLNLTSRTFGKCTFVTASMGGIVCIFDVLTLPTLNKNQLNVLCWSERLLNAAKWLTMADASIASKYSVLSVKPVSLVEIQYDLVPTSLGKFKSGDTLFLYYSTLGLGRGTKFVKVKSNGKTKNPTPNPRQKKSSFVTQTNVRPTLVQRTHQFTRKLLRLCDYYISVTNMNMVNSECLMETILPEIEFVQPKRKHKEDNTAYANKRPRQQQQHTIKSEADEYEFSQNLDF